MKRIIRRKSQLRPPTPAYTIQQKERMREFVLEERYKGVGTKEIAAKLGVSVATLYRWQTSMPSRVKPKICIPPSQAIAILCDRSITDRETLIAAVIALSVWIRWPTEDHYHDTASAALSVAYVSQTTNANTLGELDVLSRRLIDRLVPIEMLWKSCTPMVLDLPIFSEYRIDGQPHTDSNVSRDIIWYLLSHSAIERRSRYRQSLNKAFYMLERKSFKSIGRYQSGLFKNFGATMHRRLRLSLWNRTHHNLTGPWILPIHFFPIMSMTSSRTVMRR